MKDLQNRICHFCRPAAAALLSLIILAAISAAGCAVSENAPKDEPIGNAISAPSPNAAVSPESPIDSQTSSIQITLPALDAMLSDEEFTAEAKKQISLTDEELQRLKDISRNSVLALDDDAADDGRSTTGAVETARKKLVEVLGSERSSRLISLAQKTWSGGELAPVAKPNAVPTDTRIVVNAPAYRMDVFQNGNLIKSYKIGIGYPEFPLPTGLRKAKSIIFNPTWTPPDEPWVKGRVQPGRKVNAGDKLNPLGPIKIPIGLPSLIHGGKSPARLGTFASHGCVGLTSPQVQDLAVEIAKLAGPALSFQDVKNYAKAKKDTKEVKLGEPLPVELRYETIVVENGTLRIYRDIYERGTNTEEDLRKVLEVYGLSLDRIPADVRQKIVAALTQMSLDAAGKVPGPEPGQTNTTKSANESGRVTRNIKGQKVIDFKLPELAGKGYPAPVGVKF